MCKKKKEKEKEKEKKESQQRLGLQVSDFADKSTRI